MKTATLCSASSLVLGLALAWAPAASAETQRPDAGADAEIASTLDEIIVTATKRPEALFDVPVAVTAYTAEQIEAAQVRDLRDMTLIAPALSVNTSGGATQTTLTIRGVGTAGQNTGLEQSVGVFIDGVYRGRPGAALGDLFDVAQIEVLRGPQGTLFGRNTSAGVVSIHTAAPAFVPEGRIEASVGDYDFRRVQASVSGPLIEDRLAGRLTVSTQSREGFVTDTVTGATYNDRDRWSARGQLLWAINPRTELRLIADYSETDESCCAALPVFYGPSAAALRALGATLRDGTAHVYGPYTGVRTDTGRYEIALNADAQPMDDSARDHGLSAQLDWNFGAVDLTVIAARRGYESTPAIDADYTDLDLFQQVAGQDIEERSLEVRLASAADAAARLEWTVGVFLFDQDIDADQELRFGVHLRPYLEAVTPRVAVAPGVTLPVLRVLEQTVGLPVGRIAAAGLAVDDDYDYSSRSAAVFGHATYDLTDRVSVAGGLRYSREKKRADYDIRSYDPLSQIPLIGPLAPFAALAALQQFPAVAPFSTGFTDDDLSGTFSVSYAAGPGVNLFARYARGYKSGGFNLSRTAPQTRPGAPTADPANVAFRPETVDAWEAGGKFRFLGGRAQVNANLFYQTLKDYQNNAFDGVVFRIINAGEVESKGLEWDYRLQLTDGLSLDGGGTWQDVSYAHFPNANPTAAQSATGMIVQDLAGRRPHFVSDLTLSGGVTYEQPVGAGLGLRANLNYLYRSEYETAQDLDPLSLQDGHVLLNASLALGRIDQAWSVELWGRNLTDERVASLVFDVPFQTATQVTVMEPPRTWGVTVRGRF